MTQLQPINCTVPEPPEIPEDLPVEFNFYDTEAGRMYCMEAEEAKRLGVNVIRNKAALQECIQIIKDLKEK